MTDFITKLRKKCRNPRCRMQLPVPTSNEREGFCCRGCYESFYLKRCRVCEKELEQKYRKLKPKKDGDPTKFVKVQNLGPTCGSSDCKRRWRDKEDMGRFSVPKHPPGYQGSQNDELRSETAAAQPLFRAIEQATPRQRWRIVAGPVLTPSQFHCATVPDGQIVDGVPTWEEGRLERIEGKSRKASVPDFLRRNPPQADQPEEPLQQAA
jgi:hypothetical protein